MATRRRSLPLKSVRGRYTLKSTTKATGVTTTTSVVGDASSSFPQGQQVTVSQNHPLWRTRSHGSNTSDIGGDFSTVKTWINLDNTRKSMSTITDLPLRVDRRYFNGPIVPTTSGIAFPPSVSSSNSVLDAWGAKAIAQAKPTNALVDLSETLGELLGPGGIPKAIGRAAFWHNGIKDALKQSADDFLNVQFSLTPIVQDMVGFATTVMLFHKLVQQYERDAGKVVRRRWNFEPITSETNSEYRTSIRPVMVPSNSDLNNSYGLGRVLLRRKVEQRRWFSGAFTYHLPTGYSSRNKMMSFGPEAQRLLGLTPTLETLWNLAPWSWAVDWFTSAGDVVSNVSDWSSDGLVMRYGYLMEHTLSTDTYYWSGASNGAPVPAPLVVSRESKLRRRANPFGFGLTWSGLSPRQLAIAAALGISAGV